MIRGVGGRDSFEDLLIAAEGGVKGDGSWRRAKRPTAAVKAARGIAAPSVCASS